MIPEGIVLLAVQYLQHSGGRIAPVVVAHLIDFIQQQQRIHAAALADGGHNTAGHSAYIRLTVATDIRLIPDAAQTQPGQLPVQSGSHRNGNGGLAHARRAYQTDDLPLGIGIQLAHSNKLQDPLLYLLQAEVIPIQELPGGSNTGPLLGLHTPGHLQAHIQVVANHRCLSAAEGLLGQAINLFQKLLLDFLSQLPLLDLLAIIVQLAVVVFPQFSLEQADLFADDMILLDLAHLLTDLTLQLLLIPQDLGLPSQQLIDFPQTQNGPLLLQDHLTVLVAKHNILGNKICQVAGIPVIHHRCGNVFAHPGSQGGIFAEIGIGLAQQSLQLKVGNPAAQLLHRLHIALEVGFRLPQAAQLGPAAPLHHHPDRGFTDPQNLPDHGYGSHFIEILLPWLGDIDLPLGHQENLLVALHSPFQGTDRDFPLYIKTENAIGKNCQPPKGKDRHIHRCIFHM